MRPEFVEPARFFGRYERMVDHAAQIFMVIGAGMMVLNVLLVASFTSISG